MSGAKCSTIAGRAQIPADEVVVLASRRSVGIEVSYGDRTLKVKRSSIMISATSISA